MIFCREARCRSMLAMAGFFGLFALAMTTGMAFDDAPAQYDVTVIQAVQDFNETRGLADYINAVGDYWWVAFIGASVLLLGGGRVFGNPIPGWSCRSEGLAAFAIALSLLPLNALTKAIVESPRPDATLGIFVDYTRHTHGFPSGHVYNDVLFYGVMAVYAPFFVGPKLVPVVRAAAVSVILFAGWSRMVVGAHWPSDVLGGYLWGLAALALVIGIATIVGRRVHPQPLDL
jgi:membrane-associated phospholipid phosphatase